jgi:uncharacterized protein YndB with AHSA1/START domain
MDTAKQAETTAFSTPSDREVAFTRVFEAPRGRVWDAWTRPDQLPRWMLGPEGWAMPGCEIDLRPGGAWHFTWSHADGPSMAMSGVYREVEPPARIVSAENWGGDWPETLNTLTLAEHDGKTTVTQTVHYPTREARDAALGTGMKDGVALSFNRLADYLRATA